MNAMQKTEMTDGLDGLLFDNDRVLDQPDWLSALTETAKEIFLTTGLPTPAWEDWKYTKLREFERMNFNVNNTTDKTIMVDMDDLPKPILDNSIRLVFVNGCFQSGLSDSHEDIIVGNLDDMLNNTEQHEWLSEYLVSLGDLQDKPFKSLNTANICNGAVVKIPDGVKFNQPIEVLFWGQGEEGRNIAFMPRNLYIMGENSTATILENHQGSDAYFANHVTEISVHKNAELRHYRVQKDSMQAYNMALLSLTLMESAHYEMCDVTLGAHLSHTDIYAKIIGKNVECSINGVYAMKGKQHCSHQILTEHFEPEGVSNQLIKGVVDDNATAVFQGKTYVHRQAQETEGSQVNQALLLSDDAMAFAKPELEIYADNVKCSHAASSGQLDDDALFYMRNRGIPEAQARGLLLKSFLGNVIENVTDERVKEIFYTYIDDALDTE